MGILGMSRTPNKQYNLASPQSLPVRVAAAQRKRMFTHFVNWCEIKRDTTVLDVGVTSDQTYESSNYLELFLENKARITAVGIDDASFLEAKYPGLQFVYGNGLDLPFEDASFDVVHSSAVLEHVGSNANQIKFIRECARVARQSFCITTPNRYFPVEFHTVLPLVHWLPMKWFRGLMRISGREFFAHEENLNLMAKADVLRAAEQALARDGYRFAIKTVKLLGLDSNIILYGWRDSK
jgi:hypothetical protein